MNRSLPSLSGGVQTPLREHPSEHIYHLEAMNSHDARRIWRQSIHQAWGYRCAFCNGFPIEDQPLTIDHVRPKSRGGRDLTSNCVSCCQRCNQSKASEVWLQWFRQQEFYSERREVEISCWLSRGSAPAIAWTSAEQWPPGAGLVPLVSV